jgi:hypothetical protein
MRVTTLCATSEENVSRESPAHAANQRAPSPPTRPETRTFPTFTTDQSAGSGPSSTPEVSVALYRNTQRDRTHPNIRIGETVLNREQDRVPQQPITASFGADPVSRGF